MGSQLPNSFFAGASDCRIKRQAAILVIFHLAIHAAARVTTQRIIDQIILLVINDDRPEGFGLGQLSGRKMDRVAARAAIEQLPVAIMMRAQLHHFLDMMLLHPRQALRCRTGEQIMRFRRPPPCFVAIGPLVDEFGVAARNRHLLQEREPIDHRALQALAGCRIKRGKV